MPEPTPAVRHAAEQLLGPVDEFEYQQFGHANETFVLKAGSNRFVLKTSPIRGAFDYTKNHVEVLGRLGLPIPNVLAQGRAEDRDYLVLSYFVGRDLRYELPRMTPAQQTRLAEQIVGFQHAIQELPPGKGFGYTPMFVPGPFRSWTELIRRDSTASPPEVQSAVESWSPYFDKVRPTCFLDDLTVKNVIIANGALSGIVDLDVVCYGDPMYWLSLTETTVMLDVGPTGAFYGQELRRLYRPSEEQQAACDLYCAIHAHSFLSSMPEREDLRHWSAVRLKSAQR